VTSTARARQLATIKVTTSGTPARGDLRALAALLVKLDRQPPVRLVSGSAATQPTEEPQK
jgi:hypothetical protein